MRHSRSQRACGVALIGASLALALALGGCNLPGAPAHTARPTQTPRTATAPPTTVANPNGPTVNVLVSNLVLTSGSHLDFSGSGFTPGATLNVQVDSAKGTVEMQLQPAQADVSGDIPAETAVLPTSLGQGEHWLVVTDEATHAVARTLLQIQRVPPTIQLDSYSSAPGYTFGVSGQGFVPNEAVQVYFGTVKGAPFTTLHAGPGGDLNGHLTAPTLAAGYYALNFVGAASKTPATVQFDIQAFKPWVVLDQWTPKAGDTVTASGQGFAPSEHVQVYLNTAAGQPAETITTDPRGSFVHANAYTVDASMTGAYTLVFVGAHSQVQTSATFTIMPSEP